MQVAVHKVARRRRKKDRSAGHIFWVAPSGGRDALEYLPVASFIALQRAIRAGRVPALVEGFTPAQRFFIGYARSYRAKQREQAARMLVMRDVHAPSKWRVNGPLTMMPEFSEAWGCRGGDPMWRADSLRVRLW